MPVGTLLPEQRPADKPPAAPPGRSAAGGRGGGRAAGGPSRSAAGPAAPRAARRRRIGRRDVLTFTTQLAIMCRSGLDLASAIDSLTRQCRHPGLRRVLVEVHDDVTGGRTVSEALRRHADVFGAPYIASVAAGEASGRLPEVLDQLARLQRGEARLRGNIRTLLAYPVLLASVSSLVVLALIVFVLPQFAAIFEDYELSLPLLTQALLGVASELRARAWLWALVAGGLLTAAWAGYRTPSGRRLFDSLLLNLRLVREVTRALLIGRCCRLLSIMVGNGVPLLESLRLVRASISNRLYQELLDRLEHEVLNGNGLGGGLLRCPFVPPSAAEMITTAERTGTIAMVTELLGEHYEEEAEGRLRELVGVLEPAITVGMGAVVAVVVLAVMLPMFELATMGQGG